MEKQITITKITVNAGIFLTCSYKEELKNNDGRVHPNVKCSAPVHIDLVNAFSAFVPHLALICEEITPEQFIEALPEEHDGTQPHMVEMGELVPAIKAVRARGSKKDSGMTITTKGLNGEEHTFDANALLQGFGVKKEKTIWDRFNMHTVEFKVANGIGSIVLIGEKLLSNDKWIGCGPTYAIKENDTDYKFTSDLFQSAELLKYEVQEYILNHKYAPPVDPELPFGEGDNGEGEEY